MTHVMAKGANISLTAAAVRAVLRWSAVTGAPDLDVSALLIGAAGKVRSDADFVFYNQPRHPSGLVRHLPKHQAPDRSEITDTIEVDLGKLSAEVHRVVLAGSVEGGDFRTVQGLRVLLYDAAAPGGGEPLAEFPVNETEPVSALVCAELYRRDGGWKFRAVGQGYASGLGGLATDFGITVEEESAPPAAAQPEPSTPAQPTVPAARPAPRTEEPGTYTLAPAVPPPPAGAPTTPPPPANPPAGAPAYGYPQQPPAAAPTYPPAPPHQPSYGYPQQQPSYGYPQRQPATAPAPAPTTAPAYGYPQQQPPYGYPQQPPASQPTQVLDPDFALPPQGPQFQPR